MLKLLNVLMTSNIYLSGEYAEKNPDWHVKDSPFKASDVLKMIERNNLNPEKICEVGCGAGEILLNMYDNLSDKTEFFGYEISPQAYEICKKKNVRDCISTCPTYLNMKTSITI